MKPGPGAYDIKSVSPLRATEMGRGKRTDFL